MTTNSAPGRWAQKDFNLKPQHFDLITTEKTVLKAA